MIYFGLVLYLLFGFVSTVTIITRFLKEDIRVSELGLFITAVVLWPLSNIVLVSDSNKILFKKKD